MPLIHLYVGEGTLEGGKKAELAKKMTDLIVAETGQPQHYTWIVVHEVPGENWFIDRMDLPELKANILAEKGQK